MMMILENPKCEHIKYRTNASYNTIFKNRQCNGKFVNMGQHNTELKLKSSSSTELLKSLHYKHYNHQHCKHHVSNQVAVHDDTAHLLLLVEPKLISPNSQTLCGEKSCSRRAGSLHYTAASLRSGQRPGRVRGAATWVL